ncbi:MAG: hypothetical protein AB7R89_05170 [Dehalococcoidia bacterium]
MRRTAVAAGMPSQRGRRPRRIHQGIRASLIASGIVLLLSGALVDIGHHAGLPGLTAEALGEAGHMVTLAGMVLTATGVALVAALRRR